MTNPPQQHRVYRFFGRVQGVGFRYTVNNIAMRYDVRGYVKNLADGRVELVLEGLENDLDDLANEIRRKMNGYITRVEQEQAPLTGEFVEFTIQH